MKLAGIIGTAVLSLTLGVAAPVFAQDQRDQQEEQKAKPAPDEQKVQSEKPATQEEKPSAQQDNSKTEEKNAKYDKTAKPEQKNAQQQDKNTAKPEEKNAKQHAQAGKTGQQSARNDGHGRIPADRFKASFGQQHTFHVSQADFSSHRFQYGGYNFGFVDAWPSNWLYTQNVYVVDIDGVYYLCNSMYPGVNLALSLTI
jgi:hypothetical protein